MTIESPPQGDQAGAGGAHDEEQEPGGAPPAAEEARGRVEVKRRRFNIGPENFSEYYCSQLGLYSCLVRYFFGSFFLS